MIGFKEKVKAERAKKIVLSLMGSGVTPTEPEPMNHHSLETEHSIWDDVLNDQFEEVPTRDDSDTTANSFYLEKYLKFPRLNVIADQSTF